MRKLILFMHTSLDGYVAELNGKIDWVNVDDEIFDYISDFIDQSDTALYGRITYQMMENYWPTAPSKPDASKHDIRHAAWYNDVSKVIISGTMKDSLNPKIKIIGNNIADQIQKIKQQPGKNILIFGSPGASHTLMQLNLIDEYWLFLNPIRLGNGIPLFENNNHKIRLNLIESNVFKSGVIGLRYELMKNES
jgi:dihydrofolate reductase